MRSPSWRGRTAGHRLVVDARPFGRRLVVHQDVDVVHADDVGVALLDLHVAEQGDVGVLVAAEQVVVFFQRVFAALLPAAHHLDRGRLEDALHQGRQRTDARPQDDQADGPPKRGAGPEVARHQVEAAEEGPADEAAQRAAERAVAELAQRPGGHALADADRRPQAHPAEAAGEHGPEERQNGSGPKDLNQTEIDPFAQDHADGAAQRPQQHAVGRQPDEAEQRAVAASLDADDEIADGAADHGPAEEEVEPEGRRVRIGGGVGEDAE